jgi:hypothetical protein
MHQERGIVLSADWTVAAWVHTERGVRGPLGDILSHYDPLLRRGLSLGLRSSAGGYNGYGDDHHLFLGIDDARLSAWRPEGRPSPHSNYVSNSLTVRDGALYAGTVDAPREEDWAHVYRYAGGQGWDDCGRISPLRAHGVGPMVVHGGTLHAATCNYDWTRVMQEEGLDWCHVYAYEGGQKWRDCGQPGQNKRLIALASYRGQLYTAGDDRSGGTLKLFAHAGGTAWQQCAVIPTRRGFFPHAMGVYQDKLFVGTGSLHTWDCEHVVYAGTPAGCTQVHSLEVYQGQLYAGTWPEGKVFRYAGGEEWVDCGRLGDSTEVNALVVYNGKLYAGSIPRSEVYRYEGGQEWTRIARFHAPEGWEPSLASDPDPVRFREWSRVTSLTVFQGRMFASLGSCTASSQDAPCDYRGQVMSVQAGQCVTCDHNLGAGWQHVAAVRSGGALALYVNGAPVAQSVCAEAEGWNLDSMEPLLVGNGPVGPLAGQLSDVRIYQRALTQGELVPLVAAAPQTP